MRVVEYTAGKEDSGRSVSSILKNELRLSSSLIARLKAVPFALIKNGLPVRTNERAAEGDVISAAVGESPAETGRQPLPCPILYEDEDILVIDKPAGWGTHISRYDDSPSVEAAVNAYFGKKGLFHPVSRLDRGTTGAMLSAKNGWMHELLRKALHTGDYEREYLGVCLGSFNEKTGRTDLPIARAENSPIKREVREDGARAVTNYAVISEKNGFSLVRFRLETGRTHQIRVHSAAMGHPLAGDWLYGAEDRALIARPALHSEKLAFTHPLTGRRIELNAELPQDIKRIIE